MKRTKAALLAASVLFFSSVAFAAAELGDLPGRSDDPLVLTFAGDIMAHDSNYKMDDYSEIYAAIADITLADD
jgi:hypothetical protein